MGHAVKKLVGGSSSGTQKQTEKSSGTAQRTNYMMQNNTFTGMIDKAIGNANNLPLVYTNVPELNQSEEAGLQRMEQGVSTTPYTNAYDYLTRSGREQSERGNQSYNSYDAQIKNQANMTQANYQNLIGNEYNSSLVKNQIGQLTQAVNEEAGTGIQSLNRQAGGSGNMGNSRAGVAEGLIRGEAMKKIATGTVQYQTAEEQLAQGRVKDYLSQVLSSATTGAQLAQDMQKTGNSMFAQGMGYQDQAYKIGQQNTQNLLNAGTFRRNFATSQQGIREENQRLKNSAAIQRLSAIVGVTNPIANWQTTTNSSGVSTVTQSTSGGGNSILSGLLSAGGGIIGGQFGKDAAAQAQNASTGQTIGGLAGMVAGAM